MKLRAVLCAVLLSVVPLAFPAQAHMADQTPKPAAEPSFVKYEKATYFFINATIVDGTGAGVIERGNVLVSSDKIVAIGGDLQISVSRDEKVTTIDMIGKTLLPGFVMMHEHMFYPMRGNNYDELHGTFPALYLAGGETTVRTAGSLTGYGDINLRTAIAKGEAIGPDMDASAPYINGPGLPIYKMSNLKDAADATRLVDYWASAGATSFKVYMNITREELKATIAAAHQHGLKVTGHLCSVTYREAAELGIDNLEHGFAAMTDFMPAKTPDVCPPSSGTALANVDIKSGKMRSLIKLLIERKVALTSTLGIFETLTPGRSKASAASLDLLIPELRSDYENTWTAVQKLDQFKPYKAVLSKTMALQREFVRQGGVLMMGSDPTGYGGVLPGYSAKREIELLVESGFTFPEAVQIATLNAARYLGRDREIGSIEVGKRADLIVIDGDPTKDIKAIENMPLVFKNGVGYDTAAIIASMKGRVGLE